MALITYALPVADASGQMDQQIVFSRWRGAPVLRTYVIGANPQSADQQTIRNQLSAITKNWDNLTTAQRTSWKNYSTANPITNRLGKSVSSTSLGTYVAFESMRRIAQASNTFNTSAPSSTRPAAPTLFAEVILDGNSGTQLTFKLNSSTTPGTNIRVYFRCYKPPSGAWTPRYELTKSVAGLAPASFPLLVGNAQGGAEYQINTNTNWATGDFIMVSAQVMDAAGRLSIPSLIGCELTPTP